jgi:hypothetical protein
MQQYYETLRETGETELITLIQTQKYMLQTGRTLALNTDLGVELRMAHQELTVLEKLERALEGKYIDFRRSPSLEGMNFIFDRQGKVLYKLAAKPSRVQGIVDELTIFFSQLRLEGRDKYRLILVGDRNKPYPRGTVISAEIRLNEGSGFRREAIILQVEAKLDDQCNFELDFEAQDVPTITDLRVTVQAHHAIHTALLFARHRFYAGHTNDSQGVMPVGNANANQALAPEENTASHARASEPQEKSRFQAASVSETPTNTFSEERSKFFPSKFHPSDANTEGLPSWAPRKREEEQVPTDTTPAKSAPRRRRLE